ncbi:hypothetical protein SAY87_011735 [Trapa incisa]|uniref:Dof zinc finger protein n=1 Tax=Trapa incisa TaxID=236973 RepID=A0AAN7GIY8_9MYRT|nr:hypothetical protein SAY87_011735 [Trapa incisa]
MDYASQWPHQGNPIGGVVINNKPVVVEISPSSSKETLDKKAIRAQKDQHQQQHQKQEANQLNCPRCNSTNTKFCYYNNYSLSQPRYFCKTCRRYWTQGGSLRNVPVGGGSRKNKRPSSSSKKSTISNPNITPPASSFIQPANPQNPSSIQGHDLNLAYEMSPATLPHNPSNFIALNGPPPANDSIGNGFSSSGLFMSSLQQEFKPTLHYFSLENSNWYGGGMISSSNNGDPQEISASARRSTGGGGDDDGLSYDHDNSRQQGNQYHHSTSGYNWNNNSGMLGGGSWQL